MSKNLTLQHPVDLMTPKPPVYGRFGPYHGGMEDRTPGAFLPPGEIWWEVGPPLDGTA
jgi:hypothetical protein